MRAKVRRARRATAAVAVLVGLLICGGPAASAPPPDNVLKIERATDVDYVDPALAFFVPTWQIEYATCAKLVNYPDRGTPEGDFLYPEVAAGMPSVSPDGKSYEFDLRGGYAFPSGAPVTADTFKWTFDRLLHRNTVSPAQPYFRDIVGADEYIAGNAATVSGVVAADTDTLRITLEAPAADFLSRLALPFTCPLPRSVPISINGIDAPVPSAGPYYIDTWTRGQSIVIKENPNYVGARPHNFDEIRYAIGAPLADIETRISNGDTDFGEVPPASHDALVGQYGPGSPAALAGRQRWFAYPSPTVLYLAMNHDRPLFGDDPASGTGLDPLGNVNLKKAVNYAIDRAGMIALRGLTSGVPTDQHLPPGVPGFRDEDIYPPSPDLTTARTLAGCTGSTPGTCPARAGELYCSNTAPVTLICQHVQTQLLAINLTMTIRNFNRAEQFTRTGTRGEPFDMTIDGWHEVFHDPYNFLFLLDGERLGGPGSLNNLNFAYFNDPDHNADLDAANALAGVSRFDALGDWDVDTARDAAPWAPYMVPNDRHFFSDRLGCHTYVPAYGISLGALCLRGDTVGADVAAPGTVSTDPEADGATPSDSLETSVTTPLAGHISIEETLSGTPVTGYNILGQQVFIQSSAPTTPASPLQLVFLIDGSLAPSFSDVQVFRNGAVVPDCTGAPSAVPDPCVSGRGLVNGDVQVTVLTSVASRWNFGYAVVVPPPPPPPPAEPPPPAPPVPPPPPPPAAPPPPRAPAQARCVVPNVRGKPVPAARRAFARSRCALGRVSRAYSGRVRKSRIIRQSRRPGSRHPRGTRVNVVVSRGRRR
jgi:ABC-type transport system substrate-binding protein